MPLAESNQVKIRYSQETTWGETPVGPAMTELLVTSESLTHNKDTQVSGVIRSDRQRIGLLEVGASGSGDIGFEMAWSDYEPFFENAFRNSISSATVADSSATIAASSITAGTGVSFLPSLQVGQWVRVKGTGVDESGAVVKIAALTSTVLTFIGSTMSAQVASVNVTGRTLVNGVTKTSYLLEADFSDINAVKYVTGGRVNSLALNIAAQQIITGTFSFVGKGGFTASTTLASTTASAAQQTALTGAANVGDIRENNVVLANTVQGMTMNLANNSRNRPQIGSKFTADPGDGGVDVTGNLNIYFEDNALYQKMINHTGSSIGMRFTDDNGNVIVLSMPNVFFSAGNPNAAGQDQDVFLPLDFTAIRDAAEGITVRMDFLPV